MAAGGQSDYLNSAILNWMKGTTFLAAPATTYVALFTTAPTSDAGTGGTEVSGGSYARVAVANTVWSAISGGGTVAEQISNGSVITFATPTGNWGTIVAIGIYDALTVGNLLYWNTITSQVINSGVVASFAANQLIITAD